MDLKALLKRIKAENIDRRPNLDSLRALCMSFVSNIPFENMDMHGGKTKVWDLEHVYKRIVDERGGGVCCDLNVLFHWLLNEFGFEVKLLKGYVFEDETFLETSDHMALMVTLDSGARYLTDVGWGGSCFTLPLEMKFTIEQPQPNGVYRLGKRNDLITVEKKRQTYLKIDESIKSDSEVVTGYDSGGEQWNIQFGFKEDVYNFADYLEDYDRAHFSNEFFKTNVLAVIQNEKGRRVLFNNIFCEKEYVDPETIKLVRFRKCTLQDIYDVLRDEFGLKPNFRLKSKTIDDLVMGDTKP